MPRELAPQRRELVVVLFHHVPAHEDEGLVGDLEQACPVGQLELAEDVAREDLLVGHGVLAGRRGTGAQPADLLEQHLQPSRGADSK